MMRYSRSTRRRTATSNKKVRLYNNKRNTKSVAKRTSKRYVAKSGMKMGTLSTGVSSDSKTEPIYKFVRSWEGTISVGSTGQYGGQYIRAYGTNCDDLMKSYDFYRLRKVTVTFFPPGIFVNQSNTCMMRYAVDTTSDPPPTDQGTLNMQDSIRFNLLNGMPSTISWVPAVAVPLSGTAGAGATSGTRKNAWLSTSDQQAFHKGLQYFVEGFPVNFNIRCNYIMHLEFKCPSAVGGVST